MGKNLMLIGIVIVFIGLLFLKVNEITAYIVVAIGFITFFAGVIFDDKDKKYAKETIKNSQLDLSKPSYESDGKVLVFDHSSTSYVTQLWYDLNKSRLIKKLARREAMDFISDDYEYKLPDNFLENYTIDDLHYIITTRDILHNLGYQEFIQYNALLISKFKTPFSNGAPLKILEDMKIEAEKQKQIDAQREEERAEYYEFMSKTKLLFFYGQNEYGVRIESVRKDKETGEYYKVIEVATGRGIGFPPSEPEMAFGAPPKKISEEEMQSLIDDQVVAVVKNIEKSITMFTDMYESFIYAGSSDGVSGEATNYNYLKLAKGVPVKETINLLIDLLKANNQFKSNDWHKYIDFGKTLYPFVKKHTFLIINDSNMSVNDNDKEELFEKCKNNQIRLVNYNNGIFYDYINDYYFKIISEDYPGMVDDAATYREYMFEKVEGLKNSVVSPASDADWEYQALQAFHRGGMDREQAFAIYKSHKDKK